MSPPYRNYVLAALTLVYTLNLLDQGLMALLLQPIKVNLQLSDTQSGFVTGIAFAIFYATLGVPIARWADRGNRVSIASAAIGLWGMTVMSCILVRNFKELVLARVAAAVGESGCVPPTYSLLGDYFPEPAQRMRAMTVYSLAGPLSSLISYMAGGWLNERYGWRMTFFLLGIPGLAAALLIRVSVVEPRVMRAPGQSKGPPAPTFGQVLGILWRQRSSRHLGVALILLSVAAAGMGPWYAAFMIRSHGLGTRELGMWLGIIGGFGWLFGVLLGGYAANRWFSGDERGQVRLIASAVALMTPFSILFLTASRTSTALAALTPVFIVLGIFLGPMYALMQRLVSSQMRSTSAAIVLLFSNLLGMGVGPQLVGVLSDLLAKRFGSDSLRYAMLLFSFVSLWSAWHFWCVGRTVANDLAISEIGSRHAAYCTDSTNA